MPRVYKIAPLEERLWSRVDKGSQSDCWKWKGYKNPKGYGQILLEKQSGLILTHRAAWLLTYGDPKDKHVLHKCDNPSCVNPDHLFLGTNKDNMKDRDTKGRCKPGYVPGEKCGKAKLTETQVLDIRNSKLSRKELSKKYNVTTVAIDYIIRRKTWKHI